MDLGPFPLGVNNRAKDLKVPDGSLRNAVNADIGPDGSPRRRKGMARVYSGLACRDAFSCPSGTFLIEGSALKSFDGTSVTTIKAGLTGTDAAYHWENGVVYFSDGSGTLTIEDGAAADWGITTPTPPSLSLTSGTLGDGVYVAALAWVMADGKQSAMSEVRTISTLSSAGIIFQNLPGAPAGMITQPSYLRLFLSAANGSVLYRVADLAAGTSSYTVSSPYYEDGFEIIYKPLGPPPAGRIIRTYNGRAYIADDSGLVRYSEPMQYHLFDLAHGFLRFPEAVTVMEPTDTGIFFATDKKIEFWLGTDPVEGFQIMPRFDYGAPFTSGQRPQSIPGDDVIFMTHRGPVAGSPDGSCRSITEDKVAIDTGSAAAAIIREDDGGRQFIASIKDAAPGTLAATSWITAEVIRRS